MRVTVGMVRGFKLMNTKKRHNGSDECLCYRVNTEAEMGKYETKMADVKRAGDSYSINDVIYCSTPIPPLVPPADLKQFGEFYKPTKVCYSDLQDK